MADTGMLLDLMPEQRRALITRHPDGAFLFPYEKSNTIVTASSDMGDVSCIAPLTQLQIACFALGTAPTPGSGWPRGSPRWPWMG